MSLNRVTSHIKVVVAVLGTAAALTYSSLAVPGSIVALCSNVTRPIYCPVLAYGYPAPFLADSQAVSPVGSVARDPLSLLVGLDDLLWPQLALTTSFWLLVTVVSRTALVRMRLRLQRH